MNQIIVTGRLTKEPEVKRIPSKKEGPDFLSCKCTIAVDTGYGDKKRTTFFPLDIIGRTAEVFQKHTYKGQKVLVAGEMLCDEYKAESGASMKNWKIKVSSIEFLEWKAKEQTAETAQIEPGSDASEERLNEAMGQFIREWKANRM